MNLDQREKAVQQRTIKRLLAAERDFAGNKARKKRDRQFCMRPSPAQMKNLRVMVFQAFDYTCQKCFRKANQEGRIKGLRCAFLEVDRIIPGAHLGTYSFANVTCLCSTCNRSKGGRCEKLPSLIDVICRGIGS